MNLKEQKELIRIYERLRIINTRLHTLAKILPKKRKR